MRKCSICDLCGFPHAEKMQESFHFRAVNHPYLLPTSATQTTTVVGVVKSLGL